MGKITGFLEVDRLQEASEAPASRLKHWREFVLHLSDEQAGKQAARCVFIPSIQRIADIGEMVAELPETQRKVQNDDVPHQRGHPSQPKQQGPMHQGGENCG